MTSSPESEWEGSKIYLTFFGNEFPSQDLTAIFRRLRLLSNDARHVHLAKFFAEATRAVQVEISQLSADLRSLFPPFRSALEWAELQDLREGPLCGAVDGVLLVLAQVGAFIAYMEESRDSVCYAFSNSAITALGVGLLSSATIALGTTVDQWALAGADAVQLAFRLGIHVQAISENLEARDDKPETWAYVVHNVEERNVLAELDALEATESLPTTDKIFLSAVSKTSVTVSGPPRRLRRLFNSKSRFFRNSRSIALPVFGGLCHAPHVYDQADVRTVVHSSASPLHTLQDGANVVSQLFSTSTGTPYTARKAVALWESIVSELLTKAIRWDNTVSGVTDALQNSGVVEVTISGFGASVPLNDMTTALANAAPELVIHTQNLISQALESTGLEGLKPRETKQAKLAIVGMSCRLPGGATNTEKFWELLEGGLDVSRKIPADRFDIDTHFDPTGKALNKSMTQYGCFIDDPGLFDGAFFNMSPREAQVVDPQMRLALVTAFEALERSGYVGDRTHATKLERIGTYYGQAADDYREVNQGQEVSTYYIPGGCRAFGPGRINYFFKFAGPSYSIDTACSSGLAAIEVACQALWNGDVDMAVAGGVNVLTNPDGFAGLCSGHFLTKGQNACKTWDETADGYCRADAIGSVVIKRLQDAEADNDNILGVILAAGTNHSAQAVSITHPHAGHQAYLSRQILRDASIDPLDVSYIELHGTGTQAGDFEEMAGVLDVYAPLVKRRNQAQPLHIGSVKANVGHSESAAGTTALIKVLLMMQKNRIPPHVGIKTAINPRFPKDCDKRNLNIPFETTPWLPHAQSTNKKRIAAVNNFGAAGGNTMMILEDGPIREPPATDPRGTYVVAVSAKTKGSLTANIKNLIAWIDEHEKALHLPSLAYTTTARKYQYPYRLSFPVADAASLRAQLTASLAHVDTIKQVAKSGNSPPVAFAFTGQGASYNSMNLELYRNGSLAFCNSIDKLDSLAQSIGFPSFLPALDGTHPQDYTHSPVVTQLALVCTEIALVKHWSSLGTRPDLVIGHSLGEYAALHTAGVLSASDTVHLVGRRAQMLHDRCTVGSHTMVAVRAPLTQIQQTGKPFTVSCQNGPSDTVISGTEEQMKAVVASLEANGVRCIRLNVTFAFHSEQTDPILDDLEAICKDVVFREPKMPVISPLLGKVIFDSNTFNGKYIRRATREAVDFVSAMESAQKLSAISEETIWVEIGPHPVSIGFIKSITGSNGKLTAVPSLRRDEDNWRTMAHSVSTLYKCGLSIDWNEFHRPFESNLRVLDLPTYAFADKNYWMQYNGDWCLTKGNTFYETKKGHQRDSMSTAKSEISTSTVQQVVEIDINGSAGTVVVQSDLMHPDFLEAAHGHHMNGCGVVTSSIHADIAYTLGQYLYSKLYPDMSRKAMKINLDIANMTVSKALIAQSSARTPQLIRITANTADINSGVMGLTWHNVIDRSDHETSVEEELFATANVIVGDAQDWLAQWEPLAHFIHGRIEALDELASKGQASRFSRNMAYTIFAANLVDYADKYRGMQSVVVNEFEGYANIQLTSEKSGSWTVPPYFIDSVAHLGGFIMNCSDATDAQKNYCVTPGWRSMRFAEPLIAGEKYRSYVKMIPTRADPTIYFGDVYIMRQDSSSIIGVVGGLQFRRYPRVLLNRFFSAPDKTPPAADSKSKTTVALKSAKNAAPSPIPSKEKARVPAPVVDKKTEPAKEVSKTPLPNDTTTVEAKPVSAGPVASSTTVKALELIAREAGLEPKDLQDDVSFSDLGIDSLLSLVLVEKLRSELDVRVGSSLFLDYPVIGDLRKWLDEYYG